MILDNTNNRELVFSKFPGLLNDPHFKITSPQDDNYNCLAWANNVSNLWYWPFPKLDAVQHWPTDNESLHYSNLVDVFESKGFSICDNSEFEVNKIKIAIYTNDKDQFTHAARQNPEGLWKSKLGSAFDIIHGTPFTIENEEYGKAAIFMSIIYRPNGKK